MRYNIYFIVILIFFFNFSKVLAENKIVFIDINFVLEESNEGKKILKELDDLNKKNMKYFQDETSKLKKMNKKLLN